MAKIDGPCNFVFVFIYNVFLAVDSMQNAEEVNDFVLVKKYLVTNKIFTIAKRGWFDNFELNFFPTS